MMVFAHFIICYLLCDFQYQANNNLNKFQIALETNKHLWNDTEKGTIPRVIYFFQGTCREL